MNTKNIHFFEKIKYCLLTISILFTLMGLLSSNSYALTINNFTQSGEVNCAFSSCEALVKTEPLTDNGIQKPIDDNAEYQENRAEAEKTNSEVVKSQDLKSIPVFPILAVILGGSFIAFSFNQRKKLLEENANLRMRLETLEEIVTK